MKNNKGNYPRQMLQEQVDEINNLIESNGGKLLLLEMFEDIPLDSRAEFLEGLGSFYSPQMVSYFTLLNMEYGKEYEPICQRILSKYRLSGLETDHKPEILDEFYKAYASCSRHTGRMSLDLAWQNEGGKLYVECFFLTFSSDGIHSIFIVDDSAALQYEKDRGLINDMVEINYQEACFLISEAYKLNVRYMSRPALGRFLYQRYLDEQIELSSAQTSGLIKKVSARLTPRQLGNSFFHALRYQDYNYLLSIMSDQFASGTLFNQLNNAINPGALIMEGQVEEVRASSDSAELSAFSIILQDREVYRSEYRLRLEKDQQGYWSLVHIERLSNQLVEPKSSWNPFALQVYCRVYEIMDMDELFDVLDRVENIHEVEELPYGMHMRITGYEDDFNHGVSFMTGVIADLIINGDEFVIISQDKQIVDQYHKMFNDDDCFFIVQRGEYEISLASAYSYLSGQYSNFEDILLGDENDFVFEDGMRFITARYLVKDRDKVLQRLEGVSVRRLDLYEDLQVYYELENRAEPPGFLAEYLLGNNWITVSAFGEKDINAIRQHFEKDMYDALEFDGLELREEGLFSILDPDVKKQFPELESTLKELYLNKWYHSNLYNLRGMSPSEACQTEEGTRLLWSMFKHIKQKEKKRQIDGIRYQVGLKEYLRKVDLKKEGKN